MNAAADIPTETLRGALDAEWARINLLITLVESLRLGSTPGETFSEQFADCSDQVHAHREAGAWAALPELVPADQLDAFVQLDLDILAMALVPEAQPALAVRLQSLQPHIGKPQPSLALIQELLMLESGQDLGALYDRLEPSAPLSASGLIRVSGDGPYQLVTALPAATRHLLQRATHLAAPPGAQLSMTRGGWDDLILPDPALDRLKDFVNWICHRDRIVSEWGGRTSGGPLALFAGSSGTGKSFAAAVITGQLSQATGRPWDLFTLDLGRVMSKYVGETERNLNALLDSLDGRRAVLQIDEADGLLGKRGEISDARDRYANLEVSHLLSRFERHQGPVILTTNMRSNIDPAFLRRFQIVVDFPSPDSDARSKLWSVLLPPKAPRVAGLDLAHIAEAARLSGGAIHNAAQYVAVLAASEDEPISHRHVARAVWAELNKDNRSVRRSEIGYLEQYLEEAS